MMRITAYKSPASFKLVPSASKTKNELQMGAGFRDLESAHFKLAFLRHRMNLHMAKYSSAKSIHVPLDVQACTLEEYVSMSSMH